LTATTDVKGQTIDRLREHSISLPHVVFQAITHTAPAVSLAFVILTAIPVGGIALPFTLVLATITVLFVAIAIGQLAKDIPSAGGLYTYVAKALGPGAGFMVGWGYMVLEPLVIPLVLLLGAFFIQDFLQYQFHLDTPFWPWVLLQAALIFVLTYRDIRISMTAGIVLGALEVSAFLGLALWMIVANHDQITAQPFIPTNIPGGHVSGVFQAVVFSVIALIGFEGAAPLGEEARESRRAIPLALIIAVAAIGLFYIFMVYAMIVGTGLANFVQFGTDPNNSNPFRTLAVRYWGPFWFLIFLALLNGVFGNANAGVTTASRVTYAMARNGAFPAMFAKTHPRYKTPYIAIVVEIGVGVLIALVLGQAYGPSTGVGVVGTAIGIIGILMYITICVSCTVYYIRFRRDRFNLFVHAVMPLVGAIFFLVPLYYQYNPLPPYPLRWANWFDPLWILLGLGLTVWLWRTRPEVLRNGQRIFVEDETVSVEQKIVPTGAGKPGPQVP
jgi:amino acid transporter